MLLTKQARYLKVAAEPALEPREDPRSPAGSATVRAARFSPCKSTVLNTGQVHLDQALIAVLHLFSIPASPSFTTA